MNGDSDNERIFKLPEFQPELVRFTLNPTTGEVAITERIGLDRARFVSGAAGELGNDLILGGDGDDVLRGDRNARNSGGTAGGNDIILGGNGDDRIGGKAGNDRLFGEAGNDAIWGDDGDDLLWGGLGNDVLTGDDFSGGQGSDTFVLAAGEGTDTIVDFEVGTDFIGLAGGLSFGQLDISQLDGNTLIGFGDETLAVLNTVTTVLGDSDFVAIA